MLLFLFGSAVFNLKLLEQKEGYDILYTAQHISCFPISIDERFLFLYFVKFFNRGCANVNKLLEFILRQMIKFKEQQINKFKNKSFYISLNHFEHNTILSTRDFNEHSTLHFRLIIKIYCSSKKTKKKTNQNKILKLKNYIKQRNTHAIIDSTKWWTNERWRS